MRAPLLRRKPSEGVRGPKSLSPSAQPTLVQLCPPFKRRRHRTERRAGRLAVAAEVGGGGGAGGPGNKSGVLKIQR